MKVMINSIYEEQQEVLVNDNVLFDDDVVRTRCFSCCNGFEHEEGSGLFTISKCGVYEVLFRANITSETPGDILRFAIATDGEALPGTQMEYEVEVADVLMGIESHRLIKVCNNASKTISIKNNSEMLTTPALVENANIIIKKIA